VLFTLLHHGVPVGSTEAADSRALIAVLMDCLPGFAAIEPAVPQWLGVPGVTANGAAGFTHGLELRDGRGVVVPASRIDVWIADQAHLLVFTQFDSATSGVGARIRSSPLEDASAVDS
jgi:hypothetical protein